MPFRKYASVPLDLDEGVLAPGMPRVAKVADFDFEPQPGFLYVATRAISSRVNSNFDYWPPDELRRAYRTFVGRPVFVDHNNWDIARSRGVVVDAKLHESKLASGHEDTWVEILIEVDAEAFPRLAQAIMDGDIDSVSMGADCQGTICSICDNYAESVLQFCEHIPAKKGQFLPVLDPKTGSYRRDGSGDLEKRLCYETCKKIAFFEISFVFDPADESALISDFALAPKAANRTPTRVRRPSEPLDAYRERLGMRKAASVERRADKVLMRLPEQVDTLRDEFGCPRCGSEWDGLLCRSCGFELPPEGLGDPDVDPFGLMMPVGKPEGEEGEGEEEEDSGEPEENEGESGKAKKESGWKRVTRDVEIRRDVSSRPADGKGRTYVEDKSVSRYDEIVKQATLPVDPIYRQDTSPAQSVPPYGTAVPGGTPLEGFEPSMGLAPAAPAEVRDLDAPDVAGPVGQSGVYVQGQPNPFSPSPPSPGIVPGELPPGAMVGDALNSASQGQDPMGGVPFAGTPTWAVAARAERRAMALKNRARLLRERADEFEKRAEAVYQTDVRNLDEPPPVDVGPDATVDPMKAIDQHAQLLRADTPDVINDGENTGLPAGPTFRERLVEQINPFNDAAYTPYGQPAPIPWGASEVATERAVTGSAGGSATEPEAAEGVAKKAAAVPEVQPEDEAAKVAEAKAREDQRIAAAKTRILRIANFVDERIAMGLTAPAQKFEDVARFEEMGDEALDGWIQATREFRAKEERIAGRRVRVAASPAGGPARLPSLGSAPVPTPIEEDDPADDYLALLG